MTKPRGTESNPKPPRLQKVSNALTTSTNMKKLSSADLSDMRGAADADSVENFRAITVIFLPAATWISADRNPLGSMGSLTNPFSVWKRFAQDSLMYRFTNFPMRICNIISFRKWSGSPQLTPRFSVGTQRYFWCIVYFYPSTQNLYRTSLCNPAMRFICGQYTSA